MKQKTNFPLPFFFRLIIHLFYAQGFKNDHRFYWCSYVLLGLYKRKEKTYADDSECLNLVQINRICQGNVLGSILESWGRSLTLAVH